MTEKETPRVEVVNVYPGPISETLYITFQLPDGTELEFTRHTYEEYGNVIEYNTTIENEEQQAIFDDLDEDLQEEISELIQTVERPN